MRVKVRGDGSASYCRRPARGACPVPETPEPIRTVAPGSPQSAAYAGSGSWWSIGEPELFRRLASRAGGLSASEAASRLARDGPNVIAQARGSKALALLLGQFASPLVLMLVFAACVSAFVGELRDAMIIVAIVLISGFLGFSQEYRADRAMAALRGRIAHQARVVRDGLVQVVPSETIVAGDVVELSAGDLIAVDGVILSSTDLQVSEASLTGESFPTTKTTDASAPDAPIARRNNGVFAGTSVRSGTARVIAVATGPGTEFARVASSLAQAVPETEFTRGLRRFGYLMMQIVVAILLGVFVVNLLLHRPLVDSLLFSMALSVGLTPELLPAIISVTLARGARAMAANGVIVRRLHAIENLGSMDLLCTDKTGTLTEGVIHLDSWLDPRGEPSAEALLLGRLNACLQAGMKNPLDDAIAAAPGDAATEAGYRRLGEIPYDFVRRRLSVLVTDPVGTATLITKGAVDNVLDCCASVADRGSPRDLDSRARAAIEDLVRGWSEQGFRTLALARRTMQAAAQPSRDDERDMTLVGFLLFLDPPKEQVVESLSALVRRGVRIKVISGDNRHVVAYLARQIGLPSSEIMTGAEISEATRYALAARADAVDLFAEIDPNQKERIIAALRSRGHVVGYLGDGINDAPALHEADIGISVDAAVDVAREAADMILLRRDLGVLARGVDDGRAIFANTMKYVFVTTSANFGNMVSMALASAFLPFLPLLAKQVLLNNLLSDVPCLAISTDRVEADEIRAPQRWNIAVVRRFMIAFGLLSSLFDIATFAFLLLLAGATETLFQTGWFVESLLTEIAIVFVVRTRKAFWRSRPSPVLTGLSAVGALAAIALPYTPLAPLFGLQALPAGTIAGLIGITAAYMMASEMFKRRMRAFSLQEGGARPVPAGRGRSLG
ncbi:MAG: magnesium-translocating P-type ATPase [Rhizobiaceae bacterium]|nr:magnesium-translocating P-type ATPase [Rhizobiaceae bacterium]